MYYFHFIYYLPKYVTMLFYNVTLHFTFYFVILLFINETQWILYSSLQNESIELANSKHRVLRHLLQSTTLHNAFLNCDT